MNQTVANQGLNLAHYWAQGDAISHAVAYVLLVMSILSWYYILSKTWSSWRIRRSAGALEGFWKAPTFNDAIATIKHSDSENIYTPLAMQSAEAANIRAQEGSLNAATDPSELITRTLRQEINRVSARYGAFITP